MKKQGKLRKKPSILPQNLNVSFNQGGDGDSLGVTVTGVSHHVQLHVTGSPSKRFKIDQLAGLALEVYHSAKKVDKS